MKDLIPALQIYGHLIVRMGFFHFLCFFLCRLIANHVQQDLLVAENTKYAPKIIVYISVLTFKLNCNINNFKSECLLGHLTTIDL